MMGIDDEFDKEWITSVSLNKLFKWKTEGTHSLYKKVLVTNLLLGIGCPKIYFHGGDKDYDKSKKEFTNQLISAGFSFNVNMSSQDTCTEDVLGATSSQTSLDKRLVIQELINDMLDNVMDNDCYISDGATSNDGQVSDVMMTPFKSFWHRQF